MHILPFANLKGVDQPAIMSSLIQTFVVCCFASIIHAVVKFRISGQWRFNKPSKLIQVLASGNFSCDWTKIQIIYFFYKVSLMPMLVILIL